MSNQVEDRNNLEKAMSEGNPYKSYKKTILGQAYVQRLDIFSDQPEGVILTGDPKKNEESCIVDVWDARQDRFFQTRNATLIANGTLIPFKRKEEEKVRTIDESTDAELKDILSSKFYAFQSVLNSIKNTPVLFRMLDTAHELDKSDKIINLIEARIAEIQASEYEAKPQEQG